MKKIATINGIAVEHGSGNVYADLGFPDADDMLVKAELTNEISQLIENLHLTQGCTAELLGMPPSELSDLLRGKFRGVSQAKIIGYLDQLKSHIAPSE
jgi:predicted XRE-type DNA-binding protein